MYAVNNVHQVYFISIATYLRRRFYASKRKHQLLAKSKSFNIDREIWMFIFFSG